MLLKLFDKNLKITYNQLNQYKKDIIMHITETKSYDRFIDTMFQNKQYQILYKHHLQLFRNYACNGNTSNLENDTNNLFSKTNGIPFIFSHITFENSKTNILTNPKKVEYELYQLKQKYFNQFNWHIQHLNPEGILNKFLELNTDLETITKKYLKQISR